MYEGRRRYISQLKYKEQICPFSTFLFYLGPQGVGWYLSTLVSAIFFIQSAKSNFNLFQKQLHRHTQKKSLSVIWASFSTVTLTHDVNHHSSHFLAGYINWEPLAASKGCHIPDLPPSKPDIKSLSVCIFLTQLSSILLHFSGLV